MSGLTASPALGQGVESLDPDRPFAAASPRPVPAGTVQVESGLSYEEFDVGIGSPNRFRAFDTLVRWGLSRDLELRVGWDGWIEADFPTRFGKGTESGYGDGAVGLKWALFDESGARPAGAFLAEVRVPVGQEPFRDDDFDLDVGMAFGHTPAESTVLDSNLILADSADEGRYAVTLKHLLVPGWRVFAEVSGRIFLEDDRDPQHQLGLGFTRQVNERFLLHASVGLGLDDPAAGAAEWSIGAGLAYRFGS